jgi:hypothetical protein
LHIAIYDAVSSIAQTHQPYAFTGHTPSVASREAAGAAAAYRVLAALYTHPEDAEAFRELYQSQLSAIRELPPKRMGIQCGENAASAILELRAEDGSDGTALHPLSTEPGYWRPTVSFGGVVRPALLPWWGSVTPFALTSSSQFMPPPPPALDTVEYAQDLEQVQRLGRDEGSIRTADQTESALFWGYGPGTATPPGHWNQIAQTAAVLLGNTIEENARLFALLNMAMADAGISCWECKYLFKHWRPITAIQEADVDANPATVSVPDWRPLLETPPFPEYTSGHSTFSGAAAAVLALFFQQDEVAFAAESDDLPGIHHSYDSFSQAAWESGLSRIYGGIHFMSANLHGLEAGIDIGEWTVTHYLRPKHHASRNGKSFAELPSAVKASANRLWADR